jgi:adenylyl cyclase-associated protein
MSGFDQRVLDALNDIQSRLVAIERLVGAPTGSSGAAAASRTESSATAANPGVVAYDSYLNEFLPPFLAAVDKLGADLKPAGDLVKGALDELRKILELAGFCKEPAQAQMRDVLAGLGGKMQDLTKSVSRNAWERHTKTISEGIGALNWIVVKPAPRDFIESFVGGSDYWANNIRKEFRTTNADQIAFCDTFKALLVNLMAFVKANYPTGLNWNARGVTVDEYKNNPTPAATSATTTTTTSSTTAAKPASTESATKGPDLFAALNREGAVTAGLKKVTKDMQTWRSEYKADAPPVEVKKPVATTSNNKGNEIKGTPKVEFQPIASKWLVEYQSSAVDIPINDKKETVYIFGCVNAQIRITGKCKSIVVDTCKKTSVFFDVAMASCEVVNSQRMNIHVLETVSAVAIDKTDGIVVHLPTTSMHTEIVASKSSEMNVSFPDANGDLIERPIPEQYVHRIKGNTVTADVSDLYGH